MMSDFRRHGEIVGYWGTLNSSGVPQAASVLSNGYSNAVYLGEAVNNLAVLVSVDAPTDIALLGAHSSQLTTEGDEPDHSTAPDHSLFYQVYWNATAIKISFTTAGAACISIPNFVPGWTVLKSSSAANIIAGYEIVVV